MSRATELALRNAGNNPASPLMSVIIATPDCYEAVRSTIRFLQAQTVSDKLEIVFVAPSKEGLGLADSELNCFFGYHVVEAGDIRSLAQANAAGIREASASLVVLAEDHAFPENGWAHALIGAHRKPWAAVGPAVRNANPNSIISWAGFLCSYAPWMEPAPAGVTDHLPGHNSSYKREILLRYGHELESMLEAETILHWDLVAQGHELYLEPAAKLSHVNPDSVFLWAREQFHNGRLFASSRSKGWSPVRRLAYSLGSPLIPLVRLVRIRRELHRPGRPNHLVPDVLPALMLGLGLSAAGEMAGYAFGSGDAAHQLLDIQFHCAPHPNQGGNRQTAGFV